MNPVKTNRRRLLLLGNAVIILALVTYTVLFAITLRQKSLQTAISQVTESIDSLSRRSIVYFDASSRACADWAGYVRQNNWDAETILQTLSELNSNDAVEIQLVDPDTLKGLSTSSRESIALTRIQAHESSRSVSYSGYYALGVELQTLDLNDPDSMIVTSTFTNDITSEQCIAFVRCVPVLQPDGTTKQMYLMRVESLASLQNYWDTQDSASGAQVSFVNAEGEYLFRAPMLKNSNFFDFLMSYNDLTYPELDALQQSVNENPDAGWFIYKNAQGSDTLFAYSSKSYNGWYFVGALETSELVHSALQWQLALVLILGLMALGGMNILYFAQMNKQLRQSMVQLEEANKAKTRFLSSMSHDIRTPMNAILGMTAIAQHNLDDPDKVADCLDKVHLTGSHLLTLINDILDISKIESGKFTLSPRPISLKSEVENLLNIELPQAKAKGVQLNFHADDLPQDALFADPLRLNQIWINILSNAVKYTPAGGRVDATLREIPLPDDPGHIKLFYQVSDTGIGMSEEYLKTLFDPFTREQDGRIDKIEGSGLGMAITKQMVDRMGGTISVQSKRNCGSTFTVQLVLPVTEPPLVQPEENAPPADHFAGMHLLVAEDNDLNWEVLHEMLGFVEVTAARACNGAECVQMLTDAPAGTYDLIFMDIQMPVKNGYEAAEAIRALPDPAKADIPIIAMTADAFAEDVQRALDAGMNGHLAKPIDFELVLVQLRKYARKKEKNLS